MCDSIEFNFQAMAQLAIFVIFMQHTHFTDSISDDTNHTYYRRTLLLQKPTNN